MQKDICTVAELVEFEEDKNRLLKYICMKVGIQEYDASRVMSLLHYALDKMTHIPFVKQIVNILLKLSKTEAPENVLLFLSKSKSIQKIIIHMIINRTCLKNSIFRLESIAAEYDEKHVLQLSINFQILSFDELMNFAQKIVVKKVPENYRSIIKGCLETINAEIDEEKKADFVYNMIGAEMFKVILKNAQKDVCRLFEEVAKDFWKLDLVLQSIGLDVIEKEAM